MSKVHLLRIYSYDENDLPKTKKNKENKTVNGQRLIKNFSSRGSLIMDLKRIIQSTSLNSAWLILFLESSDWYVIKKNFEKKG